MACLLTGNQADAEDLLQAALAKTYLAWRRIEDRGALDGYVRRAMVNTHISWWRRRRLEEFPTDDLPDQAVPDHAADSELHDSLSRALRRLPERMRAAVVLRYYEDMSEAEIAGVLGVSPGTVKSTVSRAVAKLRIDAELLHMFGVPEQPRGADSVGMPEQSCGAGLVSVPEQSCGAEGVRVPEQARGDDPVPVPEQPRGEPAAVAEQAAALTE
jgi:RNA polymerase sigma-70 factor (sigma-E family)